MSNDIVSNRSTLREFLASIATISGDLSNITAPPFVLGEYSTVEIPQYWGDHPLLFVAPAAEQDAKKRALLVLKWFLGSLRNQQYAGRKEEDGVKKPLNAFLGELFLGSWNDEELGETNLVSEQVSHHPPVTACYLWNDKHGIRAEGFTQQEITFSGSVSIKQKGYAVLHIDKYDEDYLIPVPNVKVKGILSGSPYPELHGEYSLISSSGYVSHVKFEGKGFFGSGQKNGVEARTFHVDQPKEDIYTVKGAWNGSSTIVDAKTGSELETFNVMALQSLKMDVPDSSDQDPWESRRAWGSVIAALRRGDMRGTTNSKSKIEEGQRQMRRDEEAKGKHWENVFFQSVNHDPVFEKLSVHDNGSFTVDHGGSIWKIDQGAVKNARKPYHGDLLPTNEQRKSAQSAETSRANGVQGQPRNEAVAVAPSRLSGEVQDESEVQRHKIEHVVNEQRGNAGKEQPHADIPLEEERPMGVSEGISGENGAWKSLTDNVNTMASNLSVQLRESKVATAIGLGEPTPVEAVQEQQPARRTSTSQEPTNAQVEAFLRARHSNAN